MESLIDSLDADKWQTVEVAAKGDGYKEYKVMRQHKEDPYGTFKYLIQQEDDDPKAVYLVGCKIGMDPLKDIGTAELKLDAEEKHVLGVDLDGEIVAKK
ncbi:uncharacterized protein LOC124264254 isoform X1 [Haliotis rubra]|uniref:uncharacterized protein LOC124264254 isoform X1 n=1 Tax=Haliotis rubra TaxID=36100 RepID=UPI001EE5EFE6|nr:uncharacterized protein LOC124264254 isoform X1 [Haliotis rubra]